MTGMDTDCAKEKKDAYEMEELKKWAVNQHLGEEAILEKSLQEKMDAQRKMIQAAGGQQKWEALPEATKAEKRAKMVENVGVRYVPRSAELDAAARDGIGMRDGTGVRKVTKREERTYCQGIALGPQEPQS